jgi:hypothetical protein
MSAAKKAKPTANDRRADALRVRPNVYDYLKVKGTAGGYECSLCGNYIFAGLSGWTWGMDCPYCDGTGKPQNGGSDWLNAGDVPPSGKMYVITWPHDHETLKAGDVGTIIENSVLENVFRRESDMTLHPLKDGMGQYVHLTEASNETRSGTASSWVDAISLLKESRECIAACFRTIAASDDKMIMDRLEMQLALAGVKDGIGVRLQNFIASTGAGKVRRDQSQH